MALLRTTRRLLSAVGAHYANRRRDASLRDCDPRMLKDIGLRWERGKLVPLHPERIVTAKREVVATSNAVAAGSGSPRETCPRCGARLA